MSEKVLKEAEKSMKKAVDSLQKELAKIRTGRASAAILDDVRVEYYGMDCPLNQVGAINVPEARMLTVTPWEKQMIPAVEKAIQKADLGLNPNSDGEMVRIQIPPLTEERRKEMAKLLKKYGEECKVSIRGARREANDTLKKQVKEKELSEDEEKKLEKQVQQLTDKYVQEADQLVEKKEKEVMEL